MRICFLADGRSLHYQRWISFLTRQGHEVHFVSYHPVTPRDIEQLQDAGGIYHGEVGPFHVKLVWRTVRDLRWLKQLLRSKAIDVLHVHFLGVNAWYAALTNFHPLVITVMGGDICGPDWRPRGVRERYFSPLALRRADLITSWSHQMVDIIRRYTRKHTPVEVIHGGVDLKRFHPGPKPVYLQERWALPAEARVVLSPRILWRLYNIDQIARAAVKVCETRRDTYFLFAYPATEDGYEAEVRQIFKQAGVGDRARFIGPVPHEEMPDYYRLADVTISIPRTDGTPMSVLESMATGVPTVVSAIPDYDPQYIEPEVTVLAARIEDSDAIAAALLRLLEDSELTQRLVAEAKTRVEATGSHEHQMAHMVQLYETLMWGKQ